MVDTDTDLERDGSSMVVDADKSKVIMKNRSAIDVQNASGMSIQDSMLINDKLNEIDSVQHADDVGDQMKGNVYIANPSIVMGNTAPNSVTNTKNHSKSSRNQMEK